MLIVAQNSGLVPTLADDVSASEKAMMRQQWKREKDEHKIEVIRWIRERGERRQELRLWQMEREMREDDRARWKKQVEAERLEWWRTVNQEREAWKQEVEAERRDWWVKESHERDKWRRQEAADREKWARDEEEWTRRREEEEQYRKEVEHRRQGVWWSEPWKNKGCYSSGIQAYSAHLFDIPDDLNWLDVCMDMPIQIEGRWFDKPDKCERDETHVWGTWMIGEPGCALYWDRIHYMGCSAGQSGMKRYRARLMNLHKGDDWDKMCSTTPANILGVHYDRPTVCIDEGRTGIWDYPDSSCH
ncbi:hypothetical protein L226DRAFT_529387 [Lentinus tigrinus ALCF2SS1-7]|uniref:Uncharacterized protein n=1 Tax=Lentinus tigrinus ALCF2SS1-6 TaxID=1328759 RepID=A0A5C2ST12_9APHY|nr:hypothetical protein L227DRAFT_569195 [Lentinus tigrinus ALCF2SS1-6]RPD80935.1 hypothetical protein L226DRAFT_529387 [Lentinus tigrinus ALCF2SS1-7]